MLLLKPPDVPNVFAGTFEPEVNNAMWTIKYEFQCYRWWLGLDSAA